MTMIDAVSDLMRSVAREVILPRYQTLQSADVLEKSPGEVVTVADREAEVLLTAGLRALIPGSSVLGEEAAANNPQLHDLLQGAGDVWVVDPLDGTANFAAGRPCFAVMVALVRNGVTVASWMLDPLTDGLAVAELGGGARWCGQPLVSPQGLVTTDALVGAVSARFLPPGLRASVLSRSGHIQQMLPGLGCAGHEYPAVARGLQHFAMYWRTEPWDHLAGSLWMTEAGGCVARLDGAPYTPGCDGKGLLVAQNRGIWELVQQTLLGNERLGL